MLLPELRGLAAELGIKGTSGMRKGDLIDVIRAHQHGGATGSSKKAAGAEKSSTEKPAAAPKAAAEKVVAQSPATEKPADKPAETRAADRTVQATAVEKPDAAPANKGGAAKSADNDRADENGRGGNRNADQNRDEKPAQARGDQQREQNSEGDGNRRNRNRNRDGGNRDGGNRDGGNRNQGEKSQDSGDRSGQGNQGQKNQGQGNQGPQNQNRDNNDDDGEGGGRRRGRRFRERRRGRDRDGGGGNAGEPQVNEGDVLAPVAGILDVLDNYAFVRTSGYLAGPNDVYVSMNMVRRNGLRRGDAITGAVKVPRDGENPNNQRQKFNPLVRLDTVNGTDIESARKRPDFTKLTPLYPNQRLRLETTPERLSTRVIDLIMPIGKGQRALIVSPPKAGKTTILQDIANAITTNNPECHLMVVLVDERPEEVTDMQRSVKGEVIASTFDRPPSDHTSVAELAIERAKRLVENGMDVVVLLDSITRLGRAYNNASPASGRILSGGVDSQALYPPKRFLGAARNIENGGSLTIIASALVETGSTGDTVIFEEFKGTGNAELKLDRKISERRVFPAVDVNLSSTRKDELLLSPDEFAIVHKLRRLLAGLDSQAAIDLLVAQLKKTRSNVEFLMQVSKNAPGVMNDD
ncbi:transcription termination factor Rho [Gordonia neofelifaecis]|uniref:Transcription termination factor Rho n=1 Tax=Gordonia neofelifaecis NRRL B-59395 TaxID=644548 RepID=F1YFQ4_9ACTN|nr:transcription termination factor Rho [Gordonia neofelifaecis]EGD56686.1 transcription termination factor Rho [Gordonia neofelifaecis NRRL B-59395]